MKTQNLIKRKLSQPESVVVIQQILEKNKEAPRSAIAERVCEHFELFNAFGSAQKSGCLDALRELERGRTISVAAIAKTVPADQTQTLYRARTGVPGRACSSRAD